jgi:hypothetical protein
MPHELLNYNTALNGALAGSSIGRQSQVLTGDSVVADVADQMANLLDSCVAFATAVDDAIGAVALSASALQGLLVLCTAFWSSGGTIATAGPDADYTNQAVFISAQLTALIAKLDGG